MVTAIRQPNNVESSQAVDIPIDNEDAHYFPLDPNLDTMLTLPKGGIVVEVSGSGDLNDVNGAPLVNVDDTPNWSVIDDSASDMLHGDNRGLTGLRITAQSAHAAAIKGSIIQYKDQIKKA